MIVNNMIVNNTYYLGWGWEGCSGFLIRTFGVRIQSHWILSSILVYKLKALTALVGQLSLSVGLENGPAASDLSLHYLPMSQKSQSRFYRKNPINSTLNSAAINKLFLNFV